MTINIRESYTGISSVGKYASPHHPINLSSHKSYHIVQHHTPDSKHADIVLFPGHASWLQYLHRLYSICQIKCKNRQLILTSQPLVHQLSILSDELCVASRLAKHENRDFVL